MLLRVRPERFIDPSFEKTHVEVPIWPESVGPNWYAYRPAPSAVNALSNDAFWTVTGAKARSAIITLPTPSTARPVTPLRPLDRSVRVEPVQSTCLSERVVGSKK